MTFKEIAEKAQANAKERVELIKAAQALLNNPNSNEINNSLYAKEILSFDETFLRKLYNYEGDITTTRIAKVFSKLDEITQSSYVKPKSKIKKENLIEAFKDAKGKTLLNLYFGEARVKVSQGFVNFMELRNVYLKKFPNCTQKAFRAALIEYADDRFETNENFYDLFFFKE